MTGRGRFLFRFLMFTGFALAFSPIAATAQSNSVIDQLLSEKAATVADSTYMVLSAANLIPTDATVDQALSTAVQKGWIPDKPPGSSITFGEFSYLVMKSFKLNGGLMYMIFPGPRYSARELYYRGLVRTRLSPYGPVTGTQALYVIRTLLDARGNS